MYNKIDIDVLKEFIEGEVHDIYLFVKKNYYKDMYMTIHDYTLKDLKNDDTLEKYIKATLYDYKLQNKLNKSLKVTDGKYFDEYLMHCIIGTVFDRFPNSKALKQETKKTYLLKIIEEEKYSLDNNLISEHNISLLTGILRNKFRSKDNYNIEDVIAFLKELSSDIKKEEKNDSFTDYLNKLIVIKNMTLNQLGTESLIKKGIYDISLGKIPTKNQLIMLIIALKLNREESNKLFELAKLEVKNSSNSNIYSFEKDNERDILILHWLNNLDNLKEIARKRNKNTIQIFNEILTESNFEILK